MTGVRPRIVVVAPELPHDRVPHAGGRYLGTLVRELEAHADVLVVVPDAPVNRAAVHEPGLPSHVRIVGGRDERARWTRPLFRLLSVLDARRTARDPSVLPWARTVGLLLDAPSRAALAEADLVDLQWSQTVRLAPLVRLLNRRGRVIGTFHDVRSQAFARAATAESDLDRRAALDRAAWSEARAERHLLRRLSGAVTFSTKDAHLLSRPHDPRVVVIAPPLATGPRLARRPSERRSVLFVAHLARAENVEGLLWFLDEVWPLVRGEVPDALLRVVGGGASEELAARLDAEDGVEASGFVDDLDVEYAQARLVVVPLLRGAGVKFKTIEALVAGVPTVTTSVGAEGIAGRERLGGLADDPLTFTADCVRILTEPEAAEKDAAVASTWAVEEYSADRFAERVRRLYLQR